MKFTTIRFTSIIVCIIYAHPSYAAFSLYGKTIMVPRSSSCNAARDLVGSHQFMYRHDRKDVYGTFSVTPEYARSFNTSRIAQYFFGYDTITISGSEVEGRGDNDILADYFGLSPKFESVVTPRPGMKYSLVTFDWFIGYHNFYFRVVLPVGSTTWGVCLEETILNNGLATEFPPYYMDVDAIPAAASSFNEAMAGVTYGQVQEPLRFGTINGAQHVSGASDLILMLGGLIVNHEDSHVGFHLRVAAPTGNKPNPAYFFTPILGNGHFWELGLGFTSRSLIWEQDEQSAHLHVDMNGTYFFNSHQRRSFDLYKGTECHDRGTRFGSRYILSKTFDEYGYSGLTIPTINATTLDCKVNANVQFDIVFMFAYQRPHIGCDIGYDGWIKSRENVKLNDCCNLQSIGLKGIQNVVSCCPIMLSQATESTATLHGTELFNQALVVDPNSPVLVACDDINPHSAATSSQMVHKIFAHFNYMWDSRKNITPYLGIGGEVEFEGIRPSDLPPLKNTRSLWGLWLKGGFGY